MKKFSFVVLLTFLSCSILCSALWAETEKEMFDRGVSLLKNEQFKAAVDVFTSLLDTAPENPDVYKNRGVAYMKLGEYDLAILDFEKTREIKPDLKGLYSNLGVAWYYKGEYEKAIKNYNMEIALTPDNYYAFFNRAICRAELNDVEKSLEDVNSALALSPDFYLAQCLRGDLLARMGKISLAREAYEKAIEIDPEHNYAKDQMDALTEAPEKKPEKIVEKPVKEGQEKTGKMPAVSPGDQDDHGGKTKATAEKESSTHKKTSDQPLPEPEKSYSSYELQAGAYHEQKNALDMEAKLKGHEIKVRIREMTRPNGKHWYLVRTGEFDSRASAESARKKMMADLGIDIIVRPWGVF